MSGKRASGQPDERDHAISLRRHTPPSQDEPLVLDVARTSVGMRPTRARAYLETVFASLPNLLGEGGWDRTEALEETARFHDRVLEERARILGLPRPAPPDRGTWVRWPDQRLAALRGRRRSIWS